ncbi:oxidation resistance protein 1 isoform X1 [Ixodes scapularis]
MSSSGPTRQRSFRDRLHGIGLSWHNRTQSVDCHGYVNPLELVLDPKKGGDARGPRLSAAVPGVVPPLGHGGPSAPGRTQGGPRTAAAKSPTAPVVATGPELQQLHQLQQSQQASKKPLSRTPTHPPPGALEYVVKASDTLAGIAARFECTPGELTIANRLNSRLIFPGQVLFIPLKEKEAQNAELMDFAEQDRPKDRDKTPGVGLQHGPGSSFLSGERACSPRMLQSPPPDSPSDFLEHRHQTSMEMLDTGDQESKENLEMFLKISSRHITDGQGVVAGTLLVTPNNVMFVPNVSDPLVMEHGSERYEVTAPMDMVVAAALYNDIAHMRLRDTAAVAKTSDLVLETPYRPADYKPRVEDLLLDFPGSTLPLDTGPSLRDGLAPGDVAGEVVQPTAVALEEAKVVVTSPPTSPSLEETTKSLEVTTKVTAVGGVEVLAEDKAMRSDEVVLGRVEEPVGQAAVVAGLSEGGAAGTLSEGGSVERDVKARLGVKPRSEQTSSAVDGGVGKMEDKQGEQPEKPACLQVNEQAVGAAKEPSLKTVEVVLEAAVERMAKERAEKPAEKLVGKLVEKPARKSGENVAEEMAEKAIDETAEKATVKEAREMAGCTAESIPEESAEKMAEEAAEKAAEEVAEKAAEKVAEKAAEKASKEAAEKASKEAAEKASKEAAEKASEEAAEKVSEKAVEMAGDKAVDDTAKKTTEEAAVKEAEPVERLAEEPTEKPVEKSVEQPVDKTTEKAIEKTPERTTPKRVGEKPPPLERNVETDPLLHSNLEMPPVRTTPTLKLEAVETAEPRNSMEHVTLRMREWASMETEKSQESAHERVLKRLSNPMESISSYTHSISKMIASSPKSLADFSAGIFVRGSEEAAVPKEVAVIPPGEDERRPPSRTDNANVWLKNMVEEKPELFAALEKLGFCFDDHELVPRPAQSSEAPLLYLCLRMGKPLHKRLPRSASTRGKYRLRPQYWFGIPRTRVDELYYFLERWAPSVYGDVHRADLSLRGFESLPDSGDEEEEGDGEVPAGEDGGTPDAGTKVGHSVIGKKGGALRFFKFFDGSTAPVALGPNASPGDWEVVSMSEAQRESPLDLIELPLPELLDSTEIFTEDHRRKLSKELPARAESYSWALVYSTLKHGFSLKTLYREMLKVETPIILAILDTEGAVFGALSSCSLKMSDHFYGTGESFLFSFFPEFKVYRWAGDNGYFIKGNADSLAFGAGDGQFGLWLDGDLFHGRSRRCKTYMNDVLSTKEDFVVKALEAWGFV